MSPILTKKQTMVLNLILEMYNNRAIARKLGITDKGVKFHKTNLFKAFGVHTTKDLVKRCAVIELRGVE